MPFLINDPAFKDRRRHLRKRQTDAEYKLWQRLRNKQLIGHAAHTNTVQLRKLVLEDVVFQKQEGD